VVDGERARTWAVRIVAPVAFLAASTVLVIVIQNGLDAQEAADEEPALVTGGADTGASGTGSTETGTTQPQRRTYRVRAGDTLESIAERFDTTVDDLLQLNPDIDPLALTPGQRVRVR
jgi:LysM repeat protein